MFKEYKSLPKKVEAVQFTEENKDQVSNVLTGQSGEVWENGVPVIHVVTSHGETAIVRFGDWIIKEAELGFYYPVKDEIFKAQYV